MKFACKTAFYIRPTYVTDESSTKVLRKNKILIDESQCQTIQLNSKCANDLIHAICDESIDNSRYFINLKLYRKKCRTCRYRGGLDDSPFLFFNGTR